MFNVGKVRQRLPKDSQVWKHLLTDPDSDQGLFSISKCPSYLNHRGVQEGLKSNVETAGMLATGDKGQRL